MKEQSGHFLAFGIAVLILTAALHVTTPAQDRSQPKDAAPPSTTTLDTWKKELPQYEESVAPNISGASSAEMSPVEIERALTEAEQKWMNAVKSHDDATLKQLLAVDFTFTSERAANSFNGRKRYVDHALRDWKLESYGLDRLKVRLYGKGDVAVVNGSYQQQATVAGENWSGNFLFTDVWVRQGGVWKAVSRHLSRLPVVAADKE